MQIFKRTVAAAAVARAGLRACETLAGFAVEAVGVASTFAASAGVAAVLMVD